MTVIYVQEGQINDPDFKYDWGIVDTVSKKGEFIRLWGVLIVVTLTGAVF